jgi:hypothetical protein
MIVSIMQPYFFPYIGYFQLMSACDVFVVFDDAQYIRRGWVNRNRILIKDEPQWVTFPVNYADHRWPINRREYLLQDGVQPQKLLRRIAGAYQGAPHFRETIDLVSEILSYPNSNVAAFNVHLMRKIAAALGIPTPLVMASELEKDNNLRGQDIVVDTCRRLDARVYVNPIGGVQLYETEFFASNGITLRFLKTCAPEYPQFGGPYRPWLSIIDVLMFNGTEKTSAMLPHHQLMSKAGSGELSAVADYVPRRSAANPAGWQSAPPENPHV